MVIFHSYVSLPEGTKNRLFSLTVTSPSTQTPRVLGVNRSRFSRIRDYLFARIMNLYGYTRLYVAKRYEKPLHLVGQYDFSQRAAPMLDRISARNFYQGLWISLEKACHESVTSTKSVVPGMPWFQVMVMDGSNQSSDEALVFAA